ncbi:unnamed protein product [Rotaria magnacalcarata]|uniref:Pentatricopeptide repeat-containing protein n=5 Tax=Rotaria magnacalcarata TaxID=392030 RepID=A0A816QUF3_9BILA|nr:unnamed protein product [Rotaria magnacalcarata]
MLLFKNSSYSIYRFQRLLSLYQKNNETPSISSSMKLNATLKKLLDSKQYKEALDLFDQKFEICTDFTIDMAIKACTISKDYKRGFNIQKRLSSNSLNNPFIQVSLIHLYMGYGDIDSATRLFSSTANKSNYIYTAMFKGLISNNMAEKVFDLLDEMDIKPDSFTLAILFKACAELANDRAIKIGRKLLDEMPENYRNNVVVLNSAMHMLMKFGDIQSAERIFRSNKKKDIITYNAIIKGYVGNEMFERALDLFEQIHLNFDSVTYTVVFNACAGLANDRAMKIGKELLAKMPDNYRNDNIISTSAIDMLMKFGDVESAERIFRSIKTKNIITYGAMVKGYVGNEMFEKALDLFEQIHLSLTNVIYAIAFNCCAKLCNDRAMKIGKELLAKMPENYRNDNITTNSAIDMLMKFGDVESAERIFRSIKAKDIITYGAMVKGYVGNEMFEKALDLFEQIDIELGDVTYSIAFNCCAKLCNDRAMKIGKKLLAKMPENYRNDNITSTSAIDMLMRFGDVESAERMFRSIKAKGTNIYGALMNGYNLNGESWKCFKIFEEMKEKDVIPDEIAWNILIGACSKSGMLHHCQYIVNQIPLNIQNKIRIQNALIDMWVNIDFRYQSVNRLFIFLSSEG